MAVNSVEMDMALMYASEAQKACRSSELTPEQKGQLINKWGLDQVNQWMEQDGTEYEIDNDKKENSHNKGYNEAKDSTDGYERDKTGNWLRAGGSMVGALGSIVCSIWSATRAASHAGNRALMWVAASLNAAIVAQYYAAKPNKEATEAAETLMTGELPEGQNSLLDAQDEMTRAAEEVTELTEEAEDTKEEADSSMEEDKTILDFYKVQFASVKNKEGSGETLSSDEKALKTRLAPLMKELSLNIEKTGEDTEGTLKDIGSDIGEYQDIYDESAETMEEVQGVTDNAESFDSDTKDNAQLTKYALIANSAASLALSTRLVVLPGTIFTKAGDWIFAGVAAIAGASSGYAANEQGKYVESLKSEINMREEIQDLNTETMDMYDEELDNYSGNVDIVDALPDELEIPEDISVPTDTAGSGSGGEVNNPFTVAPKQNDSEDGKNNNNGEDDEKKTKKV